MTEQPVGPDVSAKSVCYYSTRNAQDWQHGVIMEDVSRSLPIAVIGSGAGGLSSAVALAESGHEVMLFERGKAFEASDSRINHFNYEVAPRPWTVGAEEWQGEAQLQRALGLGGTTLAYQAVSQMPRSTVLNSWGLDVRVVERKAREVQTFLNVAGHSQPYHTLNSLSNHLLTSAKQLGWEASPSSVAILSKPVDGRPVCNHCGMCAFGCQPGDKTTAANSWLPRLQKTGRATVITGAKVKRIVMQSKTEAGGIEIERGAARETIAVKAVVVAAGALETPLLLRNSLQAAAPEGLGNENVGRYLADTSIQCALVSGRPGIDDAHAGIPVDLMIRQFEDKGIVLCQGRNLGGITGPVSLAKFHAKRFGPIGLRQWVGQHYKRVAVLAGMAEAGGAVTDGLNLNNQKSFSLSRSKGQLATLESIRSYLRQWAVQADTDILAETNIEGALSSGAMLRGTCRINTSDRPGAVGSNGALLGYDNIIISDASILGAGLIAHPSLILQTLGHLFGEQLAGRLTKQ